jgi:hypothetical protein
MIAMSPGDHPAEVDGINQFVRRTSVARRPVEQISKFVIDRLAEEMIGAPDNKVHGSVGQSNIIITLPSVQVSRFPAEAFNKNRCRKGEYYEKSVVRYT